MSYRYFAQMYDSLMSDFDYNEYADRLLGLFEQFSKRPTLLLDLACGTGEIASLMMSKGVDTVAVDCSQEMLMCAKEKNKDMLCLCQRADSLDLFGTVDGAICTLDSLNHIVDIDELANSIKRVSLFLEKDCLFIFDVNTVYKHQNILADNIFVIENDDVYCVWQNQTEENLTYMALDFFERTNDHYIRYTDEVVERAYTQKEISKILEKAGLELVKQYDFDTMQKPEEITERIIYVARKK